MVVSGSESVVGAPRDRVEEEPGLVLGRPTLTVGVGAGEGPWRLEGSQEAGRGPGSVPSRERRSREMASENRGAVHLGTPSVPPQVWMWAPLLERMLCQCWPHVLQGCPRGDGRPPSRCLFKGLCAENEFPRIKLTSVPLASFGR